MAEVRNFNKITLGWLFCACLLGKTFERLSIEHSWRPYYTETLTPVVGCGQKKSQLTSHIHVPNFGEGALQIGSMNLRIFEMYIKIALKKLDQ